MGLELFQLLDKKAFDISVLKRVFLKVYHQQGAQLNQSDQDVEFFFGENNKNQRKGNGYLEFDTTVRKSDHTSFLNEDPIRLVNNGFSFCFKEARLKTTNGSGIDFVVKYLLS